MKNNINDLTDNIYQWFDDKGMHDVLMQFAKVIEEVGEMAHEICRSNTDSDKMKDAIGDSYVTIVGIAHHLGFDISECINMAYNEIKDRTGKLINDSFVKDE